MSLRLPIRSINDVEPVLPVVMAQNFSIQAYSLTYPNQEHYNDRIPKPLFGRNS